MMAVTMMGFNLFLGGVGVGVSIMVILDHYGYK